MEGSYWLRFSTIILMLVASLYVLLPTYLDEGKIRADDFTVESAVREETLQVWYDAADGDIDDATVEAVDARLKAAGAKYVRVDADDARLVIYKTAVGSKGDIEAVIDAEGTLAAYSVEAIGVDAARLAEADDPAALLESVVSGARVAAGATALTVELGDAAAGDAGLTFTPGGELPEGPVVLAVNDAVVAYSATTLVAGSPVTLPFIEGADRTSLAGALVGPIGEELIRYVRPGADEASEEEPEEEVEEVGGWQSLLPDTKLNLGLDLQGGLDMTMYVGQDEAVFSQVQRDRTALRDTALRDGVEFEVRRDPTRPAMMFSYSGEFSVLRDYLRDQIGQYQYVETLEEDGATWHIFQMNEIRADEIRAQAVEQVLETLRRRVDSTGVKEPSIVRMPGGRINIQLPGVDDAQQAIDAIGTQAVLEFRLVHEDHQTKIDTIVGAITEAERELPPEAFQDIDVLNQWLMDTGTLEPGQIVRFLSRDGEDDGTAQPMLLNEDIMLTGADVNGAIVAWDNNNQPQVSLDFKPRGASVFCDVTTEHTRELFAIMLDGQIRSAPRINEPICGGRAAISMGNSVEAKKDAQTLVLVLRTGSLTAPTYVGEVRVIGPSLGADAIQSGIYGSVVGGSITVLFMALWYRRPGVIADVALALNVLMVFALLALAGATLTLPGIAGVALTIGMAVDANIIIYERIREELRLGVAARKAVDVGYSKGVVAVLDANVTTAIAGVVLYSYGTGPIKGFAVTLLIGIFTTLVTALFVTRTFMEMLTRNSSVRLRI